MGKTNEGWNVVLEDFFIQDGFLNLLIRLSKENEANILRLFQVGPYLKDLKGSKLQCGNIRVVQRLINIEKVKQLAAKERRRVPFEDVVFRKDDQGRSVIDKVVALEVLDAFMFNELLEKVETIISKLRYNDIKIAEMVIDTSDDTLIVEELEVDIDDVIRVREIIRAGLSEYDDKDNDDFDQTRAGTKKEIIKQFGFGERSLDERVENEKLHLKNKKREKRQSLSWLVTRGVDYDWKKAEEQQKLEHLKKFKLGRTDVNGSIEFSADTNYRYRWRVLGSAEAGWKVKITEVSVKNDILELILIMTKDGKTETRVFQIDNTMILIKGNDAQKGKTKEVLNIKLKKSRFILVSN